MNPFLRAVVRTFPWCVLFFLACLGLLAVTQDLRGESPLVGLYFVLGGASGLTVLVGGARGLKAQYAGRVRTADAAFRPDRTDIGAGCFCLGALLGFGAGYQATPQGGEILGVVGGLLGFWLVSSSPLSLVFIALVLGWTLSMGMLALSVHQQSSLEVWKLLVGSLVLLVGTGLLRRILVVKGPPSWLRTFLAFGSVALLPAGLGLLTPPHHKHELSAPDPDSLAAMVLPGGVVVAIFLFYQWLCVARPDAEGRAAEPTQSGCGCAYLGLGVLMLGLDSWASLLLFLPYGVRVALFVALVVACGLAATYYTRQVRDRYERTHKGP